jgi:hypothetical protein
MEEEEKKEVGHSCLERRSVGQRYRKEISIGAFF